MGRGTRDPNGLDLVELRGPAEPMKKKTRICGSEAKRFCRARVSESESLLVCDRTSENNDVYDLVCSNIG